MLKLALPMRYVVDESHSSAVGGRIRGQDGAYPVIYYSLPDIGAQLFLHSYAKNTTVLTLAYGDDAQFSYDFHKRASS